jgi:co-chaperonin GroES (HSP10)
MSHPMEAFRLTDPRHVHPLGLYAVVRVEERQEKTSEGLYLPREETGIEKIMEGAGRIIAVGPGYTTGKGYLKKPSVKVGDRVAFRRFLTDAVPFMKIDGVEYCLMHCDDFMAILDDGVKVGPF